MNTKSLFILSSTFVAVLLAFGAIGCGGGSNGIVASPTPIPPPPTPTPTALSITTISPSTVASGSPDTTITVNGAGFVTASTVLVNGTKVATSFNSSIQLIASVPVSLLAAPGALQIAVSNSAAGGGTSGNVPLSVVLVASLSLFATPATAGVANGPWLLSAVALDSTGSPVVGLHVNLDASVGTVSPTAGFTDSNGGLIGGITPSATIDPTQAVAVTATSGSQTAAVNIQFQNPTTGAASRRAPALQNGATAQATFLNNFQPFSIGTSGLPTSTNPFTIPDNCFTDAALTTTISVACQQTYTQNGLNIQPSNLINEACNAINAVGEFKDVLSCVGTGVTVVSCLLSETGLGAAICAGALEDAAGTAADATECLQFIATQLTQRFLGDAAAQILDQIFVLQDPTDPANILSEGCTVLQDLFPPSPGDPGGRVYVADASANVIKVYNSQGNIITVPGTFSGLSTPDGMAYDASTQRIYVSNLGNNTVTVYNLDGTLVDLGVNAFVGLSDPEDVAFNPINKHFYINEPLTNQVLVFDENGGPITLAPDAFAGLNSPFGLAWDSANGLIYVTNSGNNTMNVYDQLGKPIQTPVGAFPGLNSPDDVSWDPLTGNLYITGVATDPLAGCVINQVFVYTPDGNVVATTGFTGLNGPDAIVSNGNAMAPLYYVTNICGGSVSLFDKNGEAVALPTGAFSSLVQPTGVLVIP